MRILQVTPYFAPAWAYGGPPRVMVEYATGLVRKGHTVTAFTTDVLDAENRARPAAEQIDGVSVRRFPNLSNTLAWRRKKYLPRGLLRALVREAHHYDVVHTTDARTYVTACAYLSARAGNVPLCLSAHGTLPGSAGLRGVVKRGYDRALLGPMLQRAGLLLAQTDHEAELYTAFGGRPATVRLLPLPVTLPPPDLDQPDNGLRGRLGLPDSSRIVLFVGRIHPLKGLDLLVEAVEPLLERDPSLALVVVGRDDGHWAPIALRFAHLLDRGALRHAGPIYGDARYGVYAAADVFCLTPRHWEETSLAALEAAACGTPVVLSEQAAIPGLTEAGGGFVVPLDPARIREAVHETLEHSEEMGERARELVSRRHAADAVVRRLELLLEEAVAARRER